jgi:O-antigen/teichoic acid export membrane protein
MTDVTAVLEAPTVSPDEAAGSRPIAATAPRHRRNLLALFGAQLITWTFVLAWTFIVPRRLGPAAWGLLVNGSAVAGILGTLIGLGTRNYLVREMVRAPSKRSQLLAAALATRLILCVPAAALLALYLWWSGFDPVQSAVLWIATGAVFATLLAEPFKAVFQAVERMEYLAAGDVNDKVVQATGAIALVLLGYGVVAVAGWALVVSVIVLVLQSIWARKFIHVSLHTDVHNATRLLRESAPYWTMGLFLTFYVWVDSAMLARMAPSQVVGWYGVPTRLFGTLLFAATIISTAWLPRLIVANEHERDRLREVTRGPLDQLIVLSLPIALGAAAIAGPLIRGLYGADFEGAVPVMALLALCAIPLYINIMANQFLVAAGRQVVWTRVMIGASIVNPLLNLVAIQLTQSRLGNGAIGAAISLLATEVGIAVVSLFVILRGVLTLGLAWRTIRALVAALAMAGIVVVATPIGLAGQIAIGVAVFTALAVVMRVPSAEERGLVCSLVSRMRARIAR